MVFKMKLTAAEFLVIGVIFVALPLTVYGKMQEQSIATQNLQLFAQQNSITAVNCSQWDTDGDSYVSCTAKDEQRQFLQLECSGSLWSQNSASCRVPKLNLRRGNN
jgi:hypothetical protein